MGLSAASMENTQNYASIHRAKTSLETIGNDYFPIAVVETILKPEYKKSGEWNITVVTDDKDIMIRFYLICK